MTEDDRTGLAVLLYEPLGTDSVNFPISPTTFEFHVSGVSAMLPTIPSGLQEAMDAGFSLFSWEVEGHLENLQPDANSRQVQPLYREYSLTAERVFKCLWP